jgi:hypothetical protein
MITVSLHLSCDLVSVVILFHSQKPCVTKVSGISMHLCIIQKVSNYFEVLWQPSSIFQWSQTFPFQSHSFCLISTNPSNSVAVADKCWRPPTVQTNMNDYIPSLLSDLHWLQATKCTASKLAMQHCTTPQHLTKKLHLQSTLWGIKKQTKNVFTTTFIKLGRFRLNLVDFFSNTFSTKQCKQLSPDLSNSFTLSGETWKSLMQV